MWSRIQLGDIGTWIASLGTVAAVVLALNQSRRAIRRQRELENRSQASQISAWIIEQKSEFWIAVRNNSSTPVHEVILSLAAYQGAGPEPGKNSEFQVYLGIVPPGQTYTSIKGGGSAMNIRFGVEMAFTDNQGLSWLRNVNGRLKDISKPAVEHYGLSRPVSWESALSKLPKDIKSGVVVAATGGYFDINQRY